MNCFTVVIVKKQKINLLFSDTRLREADCYRLHLLLINYSGSSSELLLDKHDQKATITIYFPIQEIKKEYKIHKSDYVWSKSYSHNFLPSLTNREVVQNLHGFSVFMTEKLLSQLALWNFHLRTIHILYCFSVKITEIHYYFARKIIKLNLFLLIPWVLERYPLRFQFFSCYHSLLLEFR